MTWKHIRKRILLKFSVFLNSSNKICVVLGPELLTFTNNPNLLLLRVQDAWRLESRSWKEALGSWGEGMRVCSLRREQVLFHVVPIPRAPAHGCGPSILLMTGWDGSYSRPTWETTLDSWEPRAVRVLSATPLMSRKRDGGPHDCHRV